MKTLLIILGAFTVAFVLEKLVEENLKVKKKLKEVIRYQVSYFMASLVLLLLMQIINELTLRSAYFLAINLGIFMFFIEELGKKTVKE